MYTIQCIVVVDHDVGFFDHDIAVVGLISCVVFAFLALGIHQIVLFEMIATNKLMW